MEAALQKVDSLRQEVRRSEKLRKEVAGARPGLRWSASVGPEHPSEGGCTDCVGHCTAGPESYVRPSGPIWERLFGGAQPSRAVCEGAQSPGAW